MPRRTKAEQRAIIQEIGRLLATGEVDREIMKTLAISQTQYFIYKNRVYEQSAEQFRKQKEENIAWHKDLLEERLTKLYKHLEEALRRPNPLNNNLPYIASKDLASVTNVMRFLAIDLFKLNQEGIKIAKHYGLNYLQRTERLVQNTGGETGIQLLYNHDGGDAGKVGPGGVGAGAAAGTEQQPSIGDTGPQQDSKKPDESEIY